MRALVLGGAGAVCSETTRDLAQYSDFTEIVVADYNLASAKALVEDIEDQRLAPVFFDAEDYDSMLKLFSGFDVVINGLPWKYDLPVTKACVEIGVNGLDVSTEEKQLEVQIIPDKATTYEPRGKATFDVRATDYQGHGVEAEFEFVNNSIDEFFGVTQFLAFLAVEYVRSSCFGEPFFKEGLFY